MRLLRLALPLHAALLFAALDAARQLNLSLSIDFNDSGGPVADPQLATSNKEERTAAEIAEGAKKGISAALLKVRKLSGKGKKPLNDVVPWQALDKATRARLIKTKKTTRSYTQLAPKDVSEEDTVSKLTDHHTEEDKASRIGAIKDIENKGVASIEAESWAERVQELADDEFTRLRLDLKASEMQEEGFVPHILYQKLFSLPECVRWKEYVEEIDTHDSAMTMVKTLTRFFDVRALATALMILSVTDSTEVLATKMLTAQLRYWVRTKVDPKKVEEWMLVDEPYHFYLKQGLCRRYADVSTWSVYDPATQDALFKHENVMLTFTDLANKDMRPDADMLSALKRSHTVSEVALAMAAVEVEAGDERLKRDATSVLLELIKLWKIKEKSPDTVFTLLELDHLKTLSDGDIHLADYAKSFFLDPRFVLWDAYLMELYKGEREVMNIMRDTVDRIFDRDGFFVKLLTAAEPVLKRIRESVPPSP
uniref:RxLR effector candidate protein n=1 Tax=Peronospora matthiolae TaxID=2874970 RepID=A0AAV1VA17_9STRA